MPKDTIKLIHYFNKNYIEFENTENYLEDNFGLSYNKNNPGNKYDTKMLYKLYRLKNLRIHLYLDRIVLVGSIPKYYRGNNFIELSNESIKNIFELIQFQLPFINWYQSVVSRLDIYTCFSLPFSPNVLSKLITGGRYFKKSIYKSAGHTVTIGNNTHEFSVYNKSEECEESGKNIVKLEYRMKKADIIRKKLNSNEVTLDYLLDNLSFLPEIWFEMYNNLEKDYCPVFPTIKSKTHLEHLLYRAYGYENIMNLIERSYKVENGLSDGQRNNLKDYVRRLQKEGKELALSDSPMVTLDDRANKYINIYRNLTMNDLQLIY